MIDECALVTTSLASRTTAVEYAGGRCIWRVVTTGAAIRPRRSLPACVSDDDAGAAAAAAAAFEAFSSCARKSFSACKRSPP